MARWRSISRMPRATDVRAALRLAVASLPSGRRKVTAPLADFWARVSRSGASPRRRASQTGRRDAVLEADAGADGVDEVVDPRDVLVVGAGQARQAQRRALHRHRRVAAGEVDDRLPGPPGQAAGAADGRGVEVEEGTRT